MSDQSTGRIIHLPNGKVFTDPQTNYTKGWFDYIWNEIPVLVTFESYWKKAKVILEQVAAAHSAHLIPLAEQKLKESSREFIILSPNLDAADKAIPVGSHMGVAFVPDMPAAVPVWPTQNMQWL